MSHYYVSKELHAPPLGCMPSQRTVAGGVQRKCAEKYNRASMLFNSKLSATIDSLNKNLHNSRIVYIDVYNPLLNLIENPKNYGKSLLLLRLIIITIIMFHQYICPFDLLDQVF